MKASPQDQRRLLDLVEIDLELIRNTSERVKLETSSEVSVVAEKLLAISDSLIDSRNLVGDLELELKRAETDLELVEKRILKDQQRLSTTSSSKDAQGIEHELESLAKRQDELEDGELLILDRLESAKASLAAAIEEKSETEQTLAALRKALSENLGALDSARSDLTIRRDQLISELDSEIASAYQLKAKRGIAVGRLLGRECGACRLSITATNLEEILARPSDEVAECPNCQAILVRS